MKKLSIKLEGQSFDVGYIAAHTTVESFIAQAKRQKIYASFGAKQDKMLKEVYALGINQKKANDAIDNAATGQSVETATEEKVEKPKEKKG